MKIVGLLMVKNEADILPEMLEHISKWADGLIAVDGGSSDGTWEMLCEYPLILAAHRQHEHEFHEARLVKTLHEMAADYEADWYVDNDADELFPANTREVLESIPSFCNVATVDIHTEMLGRVYDIKTRWLRCCRNDPELFATDELKKLHGRKIPLRKRDMRICETPLVVRHKSIRSYEQGMRKYENYKRLDTEGVQEYEHIRHLAECYQTGDFTGVKWVS